MLILYTVQNKLFEVPPSNDYRKSYSSFFQGIARTQSPLRKNYALESPTFVVIAEVNLTEVQWKGLTLDRLP